MKTSIEWKVVVLSCRRWTVRHSWCFGEVWKGTSGKCVCVSKCVMWRFELPVAGRYAMPDLSCTTRGQLEATNPLLPPGRRCGSTGKGWDVGKGPHHPLVQGRGSYGSKFCGCLCCCADCRWRSQWGAIWSYLLNAVVKFKCCASKEGRWGWGRVWSTTLVRSGWGNWVFSWEKKRLSRDLLATTSFHVVEESKVGTSPFSQVTSN